MLSHATASLCGVHLAEEAHGVHAVALVDRRVRPAERPEQRLEHDEILSLSIQDWAPIRPGFENQYY